MTIENMQEPKFYEESDYPLVHPSSGKNYREITVEGRVLWEYPPRGEGLQGAIYDPVAKKLVRGAAKPITSDTAADMVVLREQSKYNAAMVGVKRAIVRNGKYIDKADQVSGLSDEQAIAAVADAITEHALNVYAPGSAHVKGKLVEMLDMMPDKRQVRLKDADGNEATGSPEQLAELARFIEAARAEQAKRSLE